MVLFGSAQAGFAQSSEAKTEDTQAQLQRVADGMSASYRAKQFDRALQQLIKLEALPAFASLPLETRQSMQYTKACLYALQGQKPQALKELHLASTMGYADYGTAMTDSDLDSLRSDAEFQAWLAEFKAKYGPPLLQWASQKGEPGFQQSLDYAENPKLKQLRTEFPVEAAEKSHDYLQQLQQLAAWTSRQWEHSSTQSASKEDPLTILREAKAGGKFICMNYAVALGGEASAYGLPARLLGLLPKGAETRGDAHSVAEVWLPSRKKWVLADGQYGQTATVNGVPLNAVELQDALAKDRKIVCSQAESCGTWLAFIQNYLYYFKIGHEARWFEPFVADQLVLIPKGAAVPKSMNGNTNVFHGARYTTDPAIFYAAPPEGGDKNSPKPVEPK